MRLSNLFLIKGSRWYDIVNLADIKLLYEKQSSYVLLSCCVNFTNDLKIELLDQFW